MARSSLKNDNYSSEDLAQIVEFCGQFTHDPVGWIWAAYPWGEKDGPLEGRKPSQWQLELLQQIKDGIITPSEAIQIAIASGHGIGKALSNTSEVCILGDSKIKKFGELKVGDYVFGKGGKPVKVTAIPYRGIRPCFRVVFDDRSTITVSQEHLWTVRGRKQRRYGRAHKTDAPWITLETRGIIDLGVKRKNGKALARQWEIPQQGAVQFNKQKVPIDPYVMGLLIGDGFMGNGQLLTSGRGICEHLIDLKQPFTRIDRLGGKSYYIRIPKIAARLRDLGVTECRAATKYIPACYKFNGIEERRELLRGLIDTDGEVTKTGTVGYSTASYRLAEDIVWLARSLGCKAMIQSTTKKPFYTYKGERKQGRDSYRLTIAMPKDFGAPCYVWHKAERVHKVEERYLTRWIDRIDYVGDLDTTCITVDAEDGLFQGNNFIVTHNSAIVSILIDWAMSTMEDCKGVVTANTERQLMTKTWAELAKWHRMSISAPLFKYEATSFHSIDKDHEKTWRIDAIPWSKQNSEAFAGLHNHGKRILIIFDEASAIDDVIWEVVEGATTDEDTEIIWCVFGNPTRPSGRFFQCFKKFRSVWKCKQIDSRTVEITNKKKLDEWAKLYGEDSDFFKVRVRGLFPSAGTGQLITYEMVDAAQRRYKTLLGEPKSYNFAPVVFGIDPAWEGADLMVAYMRQGNFSKVLFAIPKNDDDWYVAGKIAALAKEYGMAQGFIDQGYGTGIYSALKQMGFDNFRLVPFNMTATDDYYCNKRIEMWDRMKEWLKDGGALEPKDEVADDLTGPEAFINLRGKFQLESKDDMKERGLQSPNYGDALALTFAFPVNPNKFDKFKKAKAAGRIRKAGSM